MEHEAKRVALVEAYRALLAEGLIVGKAGNVSMRIETGLLITPSAVPAAEMTPQDIAVVPFEGKAAGKPSSEWRFHRDLMLARPDLTAVVHTHSPNATAIATQISRPRHGVMPAWGERLGDTAIKELAVYVHSLGGGE